MTLPNFYIAILIALSMLAACSDKKQETATHKIKFITGSSSNKLEVIDWGGKGRPIFFLSGLGNSAHVFDDFAPRFNDSFRVYGLTRRGFGASVPAEGYDLKALTSDIIAIMDSLGIQKTILAGHSIAGEEISKFAVLYPDRVDKIIYLDAAYDRMGIDSMYSGMPEIPRPTSDDSASLQNLQKYYRSSYGIAMPAEEIKQVSIFSKEGRYLKDITADSIIAAVIAGAEHPDYVNIKCPALAIYAQHDSIHQVFPFYDSLDSINKKKAMKLFADFEKFIIVQQSRFKNEVKKGITKGLMGANHYVFMSHPIETEQLMRSFLR